VRFKPPSPTATQIADFLTTVESGQASLIIEGEAGIGKTNLWLDAVEQARTRGFRVLAAQVGEAETVLAYAAVGDLLGDIETATLDRLPDVQRLAVDRVLLRAAGDGLVTDQRVVAAALSSIVTCSLACTTSMGSDAASACWASSRRMTSSRPTRMTFTPSVLAARIAPSTSGLGA